MERKPDTQNPILDRIFTIISGLGFIIMVIGLGLDLLPGSSPGISFPQFMLIIAGLILLSIGLILRKGISRQRLSTNLIKNLSISAVMLIVMIIILEGLLAIVGTPLRYPSEISQFTLIPSDFWTCDDLGCRYDTDVVQVACASGELSNRHCIINDAGFHDTQQFIDDDRLEEASLRAFILGDSFTFGASARLGSSWVETIESNLPNAVIWNTGMPGTGNNQAFEVLQDYAPLMNPDIVILGFYLNDFEDNIYPLDQFFRGNTSDNRLAIIRQYQINNQGAVTKITDPTHLLYRLDGVEPPQNQFEDFLGRTRLGSLLLNTIDTTQRMVNKLEGADFDYQVDITRDYLQKIQAFTESLNSQFLILLIPETGDLTQPSTRYQAAIRLFDELDIPYINPIDALDPSIDYEPSPNIHWSSDGHETVGAIVTQCLEQFQSSKILSDCEYLILP